MRASKIGFGAAGLLLLTLVAPYACGARPGSDGGGGNDAGDSSASSSSGGGDTDARGSEGGGTASGDGGGGVVMLDASWPPVTDAAPTPLPCACGPINAADCSGCTFPPANAPRCTPSAPAIQIVYPPDNVLLPPNLNVISVQWTPYGGPFQRFEVDFSNPPNIDWPIITKCANQTIDAQSGAPSGGCELIVDPISWSKLVAANRDQGPVTITVRGTTDGMCATASTNQVHISIAKEDLVGTYYYWKSKVSSSGVGGQIWAKTFGDLNVSEADMTSAVLPGATCSGCHAISRDGSRMVVSSDDNDSDDEYGDLAGSLLDMTTMPATEFPGGVTGVRPGGQPPGLSAINPVETYYVTTNGLPLTAAGAGPTTTSGGYPSAVPANGWSLWNGQTGAFAGGVTVGAAGTRPAMPDWSIDGTSVVYVQPSAVASWDQDGGALRNDDDHIFGGSLYTVPYTGNGTFGTPSAFLQSGGENNYYPSYSPDSPMSYVLFNRAPLDLSAGSVTGCSGGFCPNDSFSNPAARLMLMGTAAGSTPIDLEGANGSAPKSPVPLSNSYPRWAPFVQTYHGQKLIWFTFSSTRDYGLRVLNQKTGMHQCYPPDAYETPGVIPNHVFAAPCQQPQLWMASINMSAAQGNVDPSSVAFWIPYQDVTTHNHMAQWREDCTCSMFGGPCGAANGGCGCCAGMGLVCNGDGVCLNPAH